MYPLILVFLKCNVFTFNDLTNTAFKLPWFPLQSFNVQPQFQDSLAQEIADSQDLLEAHISALEKQLDG